ncbi:hypothetical protein IID19_01535 [Patescibacteria group bacterium]|nr:hypothetical protein [Patescibacteria group bacterium]
MMCMLCTLSIMVGCGSADSSDDIMSEQRSIQQAAIEKGKVVIAAVHVYVDWYGKMPRSIAALDTIPNYKFDVPTDSVYTFKVKNASYYNLLFGPFNQYVVELRGNLDGDPAEDIIHILYGWDPPRDVKFSFSDLKAFN